MIRSLGKFKIAVPVRERREHHHPASGNMPAHKSTEWVTTGTREVEVDVRVDLEGLAGSLGRAAATNKNRRSKEAGGLVEVVVVKESL